MRNDRFFWDMSTNSESLKLFQMVDRLSFYHLEVGLYNEFMIVVSTMTGFRLFLL